jgi:hypothetical protein
VACAAASATVPATDAHPNLTDRYRVRDPLLVDVELPDRNGLDLVEHLPGALDTELVQERMSGHAV